MGKLPCKNRTQNLLISKPSHPKMPLVYIKSTYLNQLTFKIYTCNIWEKNLYF
ncbi:hypothetical protein HanIR_Chr15g0775391 [Helianthus annuus]|nr:hypothetical protein HanIR_Chr15g0775391 [Helianthus annuus]